MKTIWLVATSVALLAATGVSSAQLPELVGNWTGSGAGCIEGVGFWETSNPSAIVMIIEEQRGRLFTGRMIFDLDDGWQRVEGISGAIALDNKTLHIAEHDRGYDIGTMISPDEMELIYLEDGGNLAAAVDHLHREI